MFRVPCLCIHEHYVRTESILCRHVVVKHFTLKWPELWFGTGFDSFVELFFFKSKPIYVGFMWNMMKMCVIYVLNDRFFYSIAKSTRNWDMKKVLLQFFCIYILFLQKWSEIITVRTINTVKTWCFMFVCVISDRWSGCL